MENFNRFVVLALVFFLAACSQSSKPPLELDAQATYNNSLNIRMKTIDVDLGHGPRENFNLNNYGTEFPYRLRYWVREPGAAWRLRGDYVINDATRQTVVNRASDADPEQFVRGSAYWVLLQGARDTHLRCMQNNVRKAC